MIHQRKQTLVLSRINQGLFHVIDRLPPEYAGRLSLLKWLWFCKSLIHKAILLRTVQMLMLHQTINSRPYRPLDRHNKPVQLNNSLCDTVKQNAGRMWCLLKLFPLMIGTSVPVNNFCRKFITELKDILVLAFAYKLSICHVFSLTTKIQDYFGAFFLDLFPNKH